MKIAMIGQKQVPSRKGGIEVAVEALSVRMAEKGHEVTLYNCCRCCKGEKKKKSRKWDYRGVHICEIPVVNVRGMSAVLGSLLGTFFAAGGRYDCIHYHGEGPAAMTLFTHLLGIRTVVTIHGLDWQRSKWGRFASWYLKHGEKTAAACADEIIVLSRAMQRYFWETYGRHTVLIPNGIEKPVKRKAERILKQWNLQKDSYILYLGRIVPEKGLENLLESFSKVRTEKKLVIAGAPSDTESFYKKLQEMAKPDSRVLFTGFIEGKVLDELYSNSYLYCLPSDVEGMPISLLEAMSYGNCCICSDIPECTEVLGQYGFFFRKGDGEDLCNMLQRLCSEPDLIERSRSQVSEYVCENYNWDETVRKTLMLYAEGAEH